MTVRLANTSVATVNGKATIQLLASSDGLDDGSAVVLGTLGAPVQLNPHGTTTVTFNVNSLPKTLTAGTYTLLAKAIDPAGNSADSAGGPKLKVATGAVSLTGAVSGLPACASHGRKSKRLLP